MQNRRSNFACCGRCAGPEVATRIARRQRLTAAVFPQPARERADGSRSNGRQWAHHEQPRALTGTVLDVSPQILVMASGGREHRLTLINGVAAWRGDLLEPTMLHAGERIVARLLPGRAGVADKIWASIGRVAGTIVECGTDTLIVDEGITKPRQIVVIADRAANRIRVRFPQLEPGNLIDVIGLRNGPALEALLPATSQPAYLAGRVSRISATARPSADPIRGSATWHEPAGPEEEPRGVAYPAIDPAAGCAEAGVGESASAVLPYLAVGSLLHVGNECTGASRLLPITGCGAVARLFHDRCLTCGTSPRARVADLTLASFVDLGGDLERGCFNATIVPGRRQ
ncbi:MAG TPA: hypothetical protein VIV12_14370 [Streptosporangiaceae bacterium]